METLETLQGFRLERILSEEPEKCRLTLLGTLPSSAPNVFAKDREPTLYSETIPPADKVSAENDLLRAIIRVEKTAFSAECADAFFLPDDVSESMVRKVELMESTHIYTWIAGWLSASPSAEAKQKQGDVKINIVCPATEDHIRKYTKQSSTLFRETPTIYKKIVEPYIASFPPERTRWVTEILSGRAEQDKILLSSPEFIILPDMKWDLHTAGSLYLVAIARDPNIRSLRDLRAGHIGLLESIRREAYRVVREGWNLKPGDLRMWIHYQPTYYHFHVHIVNVNYEGAGFGMAVGQAHLLEDVISLLELDADNEDSPLGQAGIFQRMTLTYGLGEQHGLYSSLKAEQELLDFQG